MSFLAPPRKGGPQKSYDSRARLRRHDVPSFAPAVEVSIGYNGSRVF
jgi:hypothetical protein